eukprot:7487420-Prorocentrum_lima.AAC.1
MFGMRQRLRRLLSCTGVTQTGIAASDHPGTGLDAPVFRRVQQRTATPMPHVHEEDSTIYADASGR